MKELNLINIEDREKNAGPLTELLRKGAQKLLHQAVEEELSELLSKTASCRTPDGKAGVVRNGYLPERELQTGIGPVTVKIPKVRSKTGTPITFRSAIIPPYIRKSKSLEASLSWLFLKGISTGEMSNALSKLLGSKAKGLSASTISKLKNTWAEEYQAWNTRNLDDDTWTYIWADGVYSGLRGDNDKLCALVIIGVNDRGEKKFLAIEDGVRESNKAGKKYCCH